MPLFNEDEKIMQGHVFLGHNFVLLFVRSSVNEALLFMCTKELVKILDERERMLWWRDCSVFGKRSVKDILPRRHF